MITVSTPTGDNASSTVLRRRRPDIVVTSNGTPSTARLPMRKIWNGTGSVSDGRKIGFSRSEEHTSELQSLMRISYAVFCLKQKTKDQNIHTSNTRLQTTYSRNALTQYTH